MVVLDPIVVAMKANGEIHLCTDLRALNRSVVVGHHTIPNMLILLPMVGEAKFYTTLDLASAYHQVRLHEESQDLMAFITPLCTFKFKRMSFGLLLELLVLQNAMGGIASVICYHDHVLDFGM